MMEYVRGKLKRYTPLCHLWLGAVDGLAPVGGWVAVTGHFDLAAWLLGAAVACWIAGFDVIYATMDIEVDRAQGLHSIPADYGIARALQVSRALHALSVVALAGVGLSLGLGPVYAIGVVAVAAAAGLRAAARLADRSLARQHGVPERQRRDRTALPRRGLARRRALVTAPRVELRGVGHAYGGRVVLSGVDRVLEPGRALGLLGPNGSGKSTLLRCIAGLLRPRAGTVLVDGRESCELPPAERARVAYAGHRPLLWGGLSARENLLLCAGLYGLGAETRRARARELAGPRGGGGAPGRGALAGPAPAARAGSRPAAGPRACSCSTSPTAASTRRAASASTPCSPTARGR